MLKQSVGVDLGGWVVVVVGGEAGGQCCFISPRKGEQSIGVQSGSLLRERGRGDNFHRFTKAERR